MAVTLIRGVKCSGLAGELCLQIVSTLHTFVFYGNEQKGENDESYLNSCLHWLINRFSGCF